MTGDPLVRARELAGRGDLAGAASAYDRAHARGFEVTDERRAVLDQLAVEEHGIVFRYVPAGSFTMGSTTGEPDEAPTHEVTTGAYWLADTPITWSAYADLMGWSPPPRSAPPERVVPKPKRATGDAPVRRQVPPEWLLAEQNKIRLQYCESATLRATDWHAHVPASADDYRDFFGLPVRADANRPWRYDVKPMVSVAWQDAEELCEKLTTPGVRYCLPTEAEWEKAARGGLAGKRYPWGDDPPTTDRCDFDRFGEFSIRPPRELPPNGYGLHGMCGTVWEWTADWYDSQAYAGAEPAEKIERVVRGGSWADCAEAVTVSFRMSRGSESWREAGWGPNVAPNFGFRLCRKER